MHVRIAGAYCRDRENYQYHGPTFLDWLENRIPQVCLKMMLAMAPTVTAESLHRPPAPPGEKLGLDLPSVDGLLGGGGDVRAEASASPCDSFCGCFYKLGGSFLWVS